MGLHDRDWYVDEHLKRQGYFDLVRRRLAPRRRPPRKPLALWFYLFAWAAIIATGYALARVTLDHLGFQRVRARPVVTEGGIPDRATSDRQRSDTRKPPQQPACPPGTKCT